MPPIPAGLDALSPALRTLIEHFTVDRDALAVVAGQSQATAPERIPMKVIEGIPVSEMRALLARVSEGDGSRVMAELNRLTYPRAETAAGPSMSCVEFATRTLEVRRARSNRKPKRRRRSENARKRHAIGILPRSCSGPTRFGRVWTR